MTKEAALREELKKIDVNEKLSACPIDFSRSKVANPRAGQQSKTYVSGTAKSNFNDRKKVSAIPRTAI
ncbi:hypothetical protein [Secundilactobacillus silagei]|uniref:hypothetical protein n=1 Tax=Secundilactobacillus silagei TaxID=1293415 RepID=UPI002092903F|nr:hypothetical protein [Secundilactobacillus silagei]